MNLQAIPYFSVDGGSNTQPPNNPNQNGRSNENELFIFDPNETNLILTINPKSKGDILQILDRIAKEGVAISSNALGCLFYQIGHQYGRSCHRLELVNRWVQGINKAFDSIDTIGTRFVGHCIYSFNGLNSNHPNTDKLVTILIDKITSYKDGLDKNVIFDRGVEKLNQWNPLTQNLIAVLQHHNAWVASSGASCQTQNTLQAQHVIKKLTIYDIGRRPFDVSTENALALAKRDINNKLCTMNSNTLLSPSCLGYLLNNIGKVYKKHNLLTLNYDSVTCIKNSINACPTMSYQHIGQCVYGLKGLDPNSPYTYEIAAALAHKINANLDKKLDAALDAAGIAMSVYGLQNLSPCDATTRLVMALTKLINNSNAKLNAQEIGNIGYGLKNIDGFANSTYALVSALAVKVTRSDAKLNGQSIGNSVFGLKNLDGSHCSTYELATALANKIRDSQDWLKGQAIGNATLGLKHLNGNHPITDQLTAVLAEKINASPATLNHQEIGNAGLGIKNLDGTKKSTQALMWALAIRIDASTANLDSQAIVNAVHGIHTLSDSPEKQALASAIASKISESTAILSAADYRNVVDKVTNKNDTANAIIRMALQAKWPSNHGRNNFHGIPAKLNLNTLQASLLRDPHILTPIWPLPPNPPARDDYPYELFGNGISRLGGLPNVDFDFLNDTGATQLTEWSPELQPTSPWEKSGW